jgi:hypothetical protein
MIYLQLNVRKEEEQEDNYTTTPESFFLKIIFSVEFFKKNLSFRHEKRCMPDMIGVGK